MNDHVSAPQGAKQDGATFISYDGRDVEHVHAFLDTHRSAMGTIRSVGVTTDDAIARSADERQILEEISRRYVSNADLTLVLVGEHTWTRRFVDWEVAAAASVGCAILAVPLHAVTPAIPARIRLLAEAQRALVAEHAPTSTAELGDWMATARQAHKPAALGQPLRAMKTPLMRNDAPGIRR